MTPEEIKAKAEADRIAKEQAGMDDDDEEVVIDDNTDYKALYEKADAKAKKYQGLFKTEKNNQKTTTNLDENTVKSMIDESTQTTQFYATNATAVEYKDDIEDLVSKGITRDRAMKMVLGEKNPVALLDDQQKAQISGNTSLTGIPVTESGKKASDLTEAEIEALSGEEFDRLFPSPMSKNSKKFFDDK